MNLCGGGGITPQNEVSIYFKLFENKEIGLGGKVTLLEGPKHGVLTDYGTKIQTDEGEVDTGIRDFVYEPTGSYLGFDSATFLVEMAGYKVTIVYGINVTSSWSVGNEGYDPHEDTKFCPNGIFWKIAPDGTVIPLIREEEEPDYGPIGGWVEDTLALDQLSISFDALMNGALGESLDNAITLDNNANGYGWYVDLTPGLNEEFLPTANPYEWKAAPSWYE